MAPEQVLAHRPDVGSRPATDMPPRADASPCLAWQVPGHVLRHLSRLLLGWCLVTGCAPLPPLPFTLPSGAGQTSALQTSVLTLTEVHLAQRNYRVVRTQVTGTSRGFALLGLLTLKAPDAIEAFAQLYQEGDVAEGHARALINVMQHSSAPYFILFSLPQITYRADVVEFVDPVTAQRPETPGQRPQE